MKLWTKVLVIFLLSFSVAFCCVGYAALTDMLTINGSVEVNEPEMVYIQEIINISGSTVTPSAEIASYTVVRSSITLGAGDSDTVTMTMRVKNNTDVRYGYNAIRYAQTAYDNANIIVSTNMTRKTVDNRGNVTDDGTVIEPGGIIEFVATFSHKDGNPVNNLSLNSLINYEFLPWDQITADVDAGVASDALGQFEDILNGVDDPDSYAKLTDQLARHEETDRYSPDYIANFDSANEMDKQVIEELFGSDSLKVIIDGVETEVRLIIKKENVTDRYAGDEFTVYITTHSLEKSGWVTSYASPIYAAVYVVDDQGEWSMIGDMYTGQGRINGYDGSYFGSGSFDTGTWRSTQAYGSAASGSSIEQVLSANIQ